MKHEIKKNKLLLMIIAFVVSIDFIIAFYFVANFHGDIYGRAEAYVVDIKSENNRAIVSSDIIDVLYDFQSSHPKYRLMATDFNGTVSHKFAQRIENRADQYMVFFYFEDIDMAFSCITEVTSQNHPLVKLYAVNDGSVFRNWERINNYKEISCKKNKVMKRKFETEILDSLGIDWRHKMVWD